MPTKERSKAAKGKGQKFDFIVVSNRLPVDRVQAEDGADQWRRSPGGLVTALAPIMAKSEGAWVGWHGAAGERLDAFDHGGMQLIPVVTRRRGSRALLRGVSRTRPCGRCTTT